MKLREHETAGSRRAGLCVALADGGNQVRIRVFGALIDCISF